MSRSTREVVEFNRYLYKCGVMLTLPWPHGVVVSRGVWALRNPAGGAYSYHQIETDSQGFYCHLKVKPQKKYDNVFHSSLCSVLSVFHEFFKLSDFKCHQAMRPISLEALQWPLLLKHIHLHYRSTNNTNSILLPITPLILSYPCLS